MKLKILLFILIVPILATAQIDFKKYFKDTSFRFDFLLGGNDKNVTVYPQQMIQEPYWGGSKTNMLDPFEYGSYRFRIFDSKSDSLIFSKGFSTLFQEWQTTAEAKNMEKAFYQAAIFPYPKKNFRIEIDARQWNGTFNTLYSSEIDPDNYFILKETPVPFEVVNILQNGNPSEKIDVVILAEGYRENEMDKFVEDAERVSGYLFENEPFQSDKDKFNIKAVLTPSKESGTDVPGEYIYKDTYLNSTFYTFDLPRYLTTSDMKTVYDVAGVVPYDQICILVNTDRYGGGGFYNLLTVCTSDNSLSNEVFVHEFGHGFGGLGDEYYTSDVAYEDFYNLNIEPWEPNLTTFVNFGLKWEKMIKDSTPVPTPRESIYINTVGVFEGGGYVSEGIFSPYMDCRMKSNVATEFCPVCREAIKKVIDYYTK